MTQGTGWGKQRGVTLVEIIVAAALAALLGSNFARQIATVQRARLTTARNLRAVRLATDAVERFRAGDVAVPRRVPPEYMLTSRLSTDPGPGRLQRLSVTVEWRDHGRRTFTLTALSPGTSEARP